LLIWAMRLAALPLAAFASLSGIPALAADPEAPAALVAEVRHGFTLGGKPLPPEIFRDFGDGDLADSGAIWVTVDAKAAIGSNLYYDDIQQHGSWVVQKQQTGEESAYRYIGAAQNGLLAVLTSYSGGGSGIFMTLHVLDLTAAHGFDLDGKRYDRIDLTNLRTMVLGDRWDGEVSIAGNKITIVTTRSGPTDDSGKRRTTTVEAARP
jgi:hypothetical protein